MRPAPPALLDRPVAHRGLWRPGGPPENTLAAFAAARAAGYGVELDVQLTADGGAVVFHDPDLKRMTGRRGAVRDLQANELTRLRLAGSDQTIPTLEAGLRTLGETPVFVELKTPTGEEGPLERAVARALADHRGPVMVISFNPFALAEFRRLAPRVPRGLSGAAHVDFGAALATPDPDRPFQPDHMSLVAPSALIVGKGLLADRRIQALRAGGLPVVGWTLRTPAERTAAAPLADALMVEGAAA